RGILGLVVLGAVVGDPLGQAVVPHAVFDQVTGHRGRGVPVPGDRPAGKLAADRVALDRDQYTVGEDGLAGAHRVGEVVGGLGLRVVVERHPVLGTDRLGGHEPAVGGAEPALRGAVP